MRLLGEFSRLCSEFEGLHECVYRYSVDEWFALLGFLRLVVLAYLALRACGGRRRVKAAPKKKTE